MSAPRDDDQVEYRPGRTIRRDVGLRLGLFAPEMLLGRSRATAPARPGGPQLVTVVPPPLQPSHADLVLAVPALSATYEEVARDLVAASASAIGLTCEQATAAWPPEPAPPARARKPRPARRPLADILADAERGHRALVRR